MSLKVLLVFFSLFCFFSPFISQEPFGLKGIATLIGKRLLVVCHRLVISCNKRKNLCTSTTSMSFSGPSCILPSSVKSLLLLACEGRGWQRRIVVEIDCPSSVVSPPTNGMFSGGTDIPVRPDKADDRQGILISHHSCCHWNIYKADSPRLVLYYSI